MYCPNCSSEASKDQKFCRLCGMELQTVAELIRDQTPSLKCARTGNAAFLPWQRTMLVWGFIAMLVGVAVGAALKMLTKENIHPAGAFTPYLSVLAMLVALLGIGLMCYPILQAAWVNPTKNKRSLMPHELTTGMQTDLLNEAPASIVEHTTEFLERSELRINVRDTANQNE